jgi:4-amino-4-deoxy-L-arabinose transferase-like glycosyltransferase
MSRYFSRERFGSPQFVAGFILLAFLGQCLWFASKIPLSDREVAFVLQGQHEWQTGDLSFHERPSPVTGLLAALPVLFTSPAGHDTPPWWQWLVRIPFMIIGMMCGASIWYVARRLYGNFAGYTALVLYAFSPLFVIHSSTVGPEIVATWGAFGIIFTAIGVAHTLYAPREVVLWNWKRILLLGTAIGVSASAHFGVLLLLPCALAFMWYLVPERRAAAAGILLASCVVGALIMWAVFGFHARLVSESLVASRWSEISPKLLVTPETWSLLGVFFVRQQPTVTLLLLISLTTYVSWKRARFFGTTAPLLMFLLVLLLGVVMPHVGGFTFYLAALPFGFVFISGVFSDLIESKYAFLSLGMLLGVLLGQVLISISGLIRL